MAVSNIIQGRPALDQIQIRFWLNAGLKGALKKRVLLIVTMGSDLVDAANPVLKALSAPMPMLAFKAALWRV